MRPRKNGEAVREDLRRRREGELAAGTYKAQNRAAWPDFVAEYDRRVLAGLAPRSRDEALASLNCFARIVKPVHVLALTTEKIDDFIAARRREETTLGGGGAQGVARHRQQGPPSRQGRPRLRRRVGAPAEAAEVPHGADTQEAADLHAAGTLRQALQGVRPARWPDDRPYPAADWWRGSDRHGYMTGWRIGQILALRREDVDLEEGTAVITGGRQQGQARPAHPPAPRWSSITCKRCQLSSAACSRGTTAGGAVRRIPHDSGPPPASRQSARTRRRYYGFHDFRRAFATMNAGQADAGRPAGPHAAQGLPDDAALHRHGPAVKPAVHDLFVPDVKRKETGAGRGAAEAAMATLW